MNNLVYQPAGTRNTAVGKQTANNLKRTIVDGVSIEEIQSYLDDEMVERLSAQYPDGKIRLWGIVAAHLSKWKRLNEGDIVIINNNAVIRYSGVVSCTTRNRELATHLWGVKEDSENGDTWELIYFLIDMKEQNIPFGEIIAATGNGGRMSFGVYSENESTAGLSAFSYFGHRSVRNPIWKRDELILVLDLYFSDATAVGNRNHPAIVELSNLLRRLPLHPSSITKRETFRNANSVDLQLANFLAFDKRSESKGMGRVSKADKEIFEEFEGNRKQLAIEAAFIRENYEKFSPPNEGEEDGYEADEGRIVLRIHKSYERNSKLVATKKARVMEKLGTLACEVCGFDFQKAYGDLGNGFAECHHKKPVSEMGESEKTTAEDLAILCSNCHRMIHRKRPWKSIHELRAMLAS
jgi:5-methylcytosine-specific restriction protein A